MKDTTDTGGQVVVIFGGRSEIGAELARSWLIDRAWFDVTQKAWEMLKADNGISVLAAVNYGRTEFCEKSTANIQLSSLPGRTSYDPSQDISAAFV